MAIWQDFRFAIRVLVKDRFLTTVAVLALGLGIGANATVFTCVNAVLLRGLPYPHANRILHIGSVNLANGDVDGVSFADLADMREQARVFESLAAFTNGTMNVSEAGRAPERYSGAWVTANLFDLLRQPPLIGRTFLRGEDEPGAESLVVLGYRMWADRYGADPKILGRTIKVNEVPATIVGVMPEGFRFPSNGDLWQTLAGRRAGETRESRFLDVIGVARPGVTAEQAGSEMTTIYARLARQYPDTNKDIGARVQTYNDRVNGGPVKVVFGALMGAVAFLLLIACANVANLLLARSSVRAREIAVRVSLGATRWRIVRQLLVESAIVAAMAGALGLAIAAVGVRLFERAVADTGKPYWMVFTIDYKVLAFLAVVCLATAVLFGLAPALHVSRTDINETLKQGGRGGSSGRRARRLTATLVVVEMALALVLLTGAGLMVRSFLTLYSMDLGIHPERVLTSAMVLAERKYQKPADWSAFHDKLAERLASAPGVRAAAVTVALPLGGGDTREFQVEGQAPTTGQREARATMVAIGPGYFETLELAMKSGRTFRQEDGRPGAENVIVNQRWVDKFCADRHPVGTRIRIKREAGYSPWLTIVGVSPTVQQASAQTAAQADPVFYVPFRMEPGRFAFILARGAGNPAAIAKIVREEVRAVDADQPVYRVMTMADALAASRWPYRVFGGLLGIFALIALGLSMLGVYAVTSYSVAQRTAEIGVRMALGASGGTITWLVLRRAVIQAAVGLVVGSLAGFGLSRVLTSVLVKSTADDPLTYVAVIGVFVATTIVACLVPAWRATRVDPLAVLRTE